MTGLFQTMNMVGITAAAMTPASAISNRVASHQHSRSLKDNARCQAARDLSALARGFASLRALRDGWDGPNSVAPTSDIIDRAAHVLSFALKDVSLVEVPAIVPVANGGLQAEWYSSAYRFELYFEPDGEIAAWSENRETGVEMEEEGRDAIDLLVRWTSGLNDDRRFA